MADPDGVAGEAAVVAFLFEVEGGLGWRTSFEAAYGIYGCFGFNTF